eukprot:superscaffoldBa00007359_g22459
MPESVELLIRVAGVPGQLRAQTNSHMELRGIRGPVGGQDLRGLGFGIPATGIPASSIITAVQQQDYSASVWLRRRDKLEH